MNRIFMILPVFIGLIFINANSKAALGDPVTPQTTVTSPPANPVPNELNPGPLQQGTMNDPTGMNNPASGAIKNRPLHRRWDKSRAANKELPTSKPTQNCDSNDIPCMQNQDISSPVR